MLPKKLSSAGFVPSARVSHHASSSRTPKLHRMVTDDTLATSSFDPYYADTASSAITAATSSPGITSVQEFEPVLNVEAAASFTVIAIVFTLLQLRINAVSNAAKRRSSALEALRKAESLQLSASDVGIDASDRPTEDQVLRAKNEYENSLRDEMNLRTIIPGVRIVAPNDPKRDEEERAAAKRFLGWGSEEFGGELEEIDEPKLSNIAPRSQQSNGQEVKKAEDEGMSNSAKAILFGVATMLIVLLWTLSFDPMVADQVFTSVGGSPPSDMPSSSW